MKKALLEILEPIQSHLTTVDEIITSNLKTGVPQIDESTLYLFSQGGKKIRASLVLLANGIGGNLVEGIHEIAAAVEIIHAGTLIHDDIIDQSIVRRGNKTVSKQYGNKIAVLSGDFLYTNAMNIIVKDPETKIFPVIVSSTRDMVQGELYQIQYSDIENISEDHYFNIIELKTARFMAGCTKMGAMKAGMNQEHCNKMYEMGLYFGYAFQIIDDMLDITGQEIGKDTDNDFHDKKVTLPLIHYYFNSDEAKQNDLVTIFSNQDKTNWNIIKNTIKENGSLDYAFTVAIEYIQKGKKILEEFPNNEYRNIIIELADFFVKRKF